MVTDDIAWYIDRKTYKNVDLSKQWLDMEDGKGIVFVKKNNEKLERFMNWMKVAGIADFKKLWGVINKDLPAGVYSVEVDASSPKTSIKCE